jgi:hypothetical protein
MKFRVETKENRWNVRLPIQMEVDVSLPGQGSVRGRTRNLSFEGMFIEVAPVEFARHALVDVALPLAPNGRATAHRIRAAVTRIADNGISLMFTDYDAATFDVLADVLGRHLDAFRSQ